MCASPTKHSDTPDCLATLISEYPLSRPYPNWALQEIQDAVSFALDIPLRIVDRNTVERFAHPDRQLPNEIHASFHAFEDLVGDHVQSPIECARIIRDNLPIPDPFETLFQYLQKNLWLTGGSYSNPSLTLLREHEPWRYWETFHVLSVCMRLLAKESPDNTGALPITIGNNTLMAGTRRLGALGGWLYAGPSWKWQDPEALGEDSGQEVTDNFINDVLAVIHHKPDLSSQSHRIKRLGAIRAACTIADHLRRLERAGLTLDLALNAEAEGSSLHEWHKSARIGVNHWIGLAQLCLTLAGHDQTAAIGENGGVRFRPPTLKHPMQPNTGHTKEPRQNAPFGREISIHAILDTNQEWQIRFHEDSRHSVTWPGGDAVTGRIQFLKPVKNQERLKSLQDVDIVLSNLTDKITTSRTYYLQERIRLFQFRLEDQLVAFHGATARKAGAPYTPAPIDRNFENSPISSDSLQTLCYALNADICAVYQYYPMEDGLGMWNSHYRNSDHQSSWALATAELMWKIRNNSELRSRSICYRALKYGTTIIEPEGRQLVLPEGDESAGGAALAVPIQICGRTWGVLELRGESRHQFRVSTPRWAHEFGRIIGGILFSRWMSAHLHGLNAALLKVLGDQNPNIDHAYDILCRCLAELFLVESVSLWKRIPDEVGGIRDIYECKWSVNHPRQDRLPHEPHDEANERAGTPAWFSADRSNLKHEKAIGADFINQNEIWWYDKLRLAAETGGSYVRDLRDANYTEFGLLKCKNSVGRYDAFLWLVSDRECAFDQRWMGLIQFFSDHVGVLLELIDSRSKFAGVADRILAHEIGGYSRSILDSLDGLDDCLGPLFSSEEVTSASKKLIRFIENEYRLDALAIPGSRDKLQEIFVAFSSLFEAAQVKGRHDSSFEVYGQMARMKATISALEEDVVTLLARFRGENITQPEYRGVEVNAAEVYRDVTKARRWDASIIYEGPRDGPYVRMPFQRLRQIFQNLINNARKYNIGRGPVRVRIRENVGDWARVEFSNFGWAVSKAEEEGIFAEGVRAAHALDLWPDEGEGMGLSIVQRIADEWGLEFCLKTSIARHGEIDMRHSTVVRYMERGKTLNETIFQEYRFSISFGKKLLTRSRPV